MTLDEITALHALCFPDAPLPKPELAALLEPPHMRLFSVEQGFLIASMVPPEAEVILIGVAPSARRQGKAQELLRALRDHADTVFLEVAEDNDAAHALYTKLGFQTVGRRPNYYTSKSGDKTHALIMRWSLT